LTAHGRSEHALPVVSNHPDRPAVGLVPPAPSRPSGEPFRCQRSG
jgi:hypothetical protein